MRPKHEYARYCIRNHIPFIVNKSSLEIIVKLQTKIVRITSLSKYNAHTEPIFKSLKLLKLTDILKLHELKFYYKYTNNKLPLYLSNLHFVQNAERHNHFTRAQCNLYMMTPKPEYARYCIRYRIPLIINESPPEIINNVDTHNLQGFSKHIKIKILESYNENCTIQNCYICNRKL